MHIARIFFSTVGYAMQMTVGELIRDAREREGITQVDLAERVGQLTGHRSTQMIVRYGRRKASENALRLQRQYMGGVG